MATSVVSRVGGGFGVGVNATLAEQIRKCQEEILTLQNQLQHERENKKGDATLPFVPESNHLPVVHTHSLRQRKQYKGHFGKVYALSWCYGEGRDELFVSASQDGKLIIWDSISTNKKVLIPLRSAWVMAVAYSPSGESVACGGLDNVCSIYKVDNYAMKLATMGDEKMRDPVPSYELAKHEGYLSSCKFITEEKILTGSGDSLAILWDIVKNQAITIFKGHESDVMTITANERGDVFYSGSCDATAKVWDARTGSCVQTHEGHESDVNSLALFPDQYAFATGSDDSTCKFFDSRTWGELNCYKDDKVISNVTAVTFSSSGRYLFAGYDDLSVQVWDAVRATLLNPTLQQHEARVSCLGVNKPGTALATGSWDCYVRCWA